MASHVEVITTDLRRAKVQVYPGTTLSQVLEKACQTLKLSRDDYLLKHKNKPLDLLLPFRSSGLGSGAKLELIVRSSSPSVVSVALQFSPSDPSVPGSRLTDKFPSNFSLWKVLRQFESGSGNPGYNLNITGRGIAQTSGGQQGQLYYETPVLNVMGREFAAISDLQRTLAQVGITSGSVLLRLSFRKTEQTLYEAMNEIKQYFDESGKDGAGRGGTAAAESVPQTDLSNGDQEQAEDSTERLATAPDVIAASTSPPQAVSTIDLDMNMDATTAAPSDPLQPVTVFSAPTSSTPKAATVNIPESAYEPSIAHAQLHQSRLQVDSRNKRLKSDRELAVDAAAAAARIAAVKSIHVRVRFPDNTMAQWQFDTNATGATLFDAVRGVSAHANQRFKLVLPGGQGSVADSSEDKHRLIKGYGLKGGVLLSLHWEDGASSTARTQPFLLKQFANQAQEVKVPEPGLDAQDETVSQPAKVEKPEAKFGDGTGKKLPKWLKLPGKK